MVSRRTGIYHVSVTSLYITLSFFFLYDSELLAGSRGTRSDQDGRCLTVHKVIRLFNPEYHNIIIAYLFSILWHPLSHLYLATDSCANLTSELCLGHFSNTITISTSQLPFQLPNPNPVPRRYTPPTARKKLHYRPHLDYRLTGRMTGKQPRLYARHP